MTRDHRLPERKVFSDEEDSDEEVSDEEFVVPKRKRKVPEPQELRLVIPKKHLPRPISAPSTTGVKRRANNPPGPPPGPPPKRPRIRRE